MEKQTTFIQSPDSSPRIVRLTTVPTSHYFWLALICVGPLLLLFLQLAPAFNYEVYHNSLGHVLIVGLVTLLASALALRVLAIATRANDGRVFLIGMGFLAVASIFVIHAVSTPDVLMTGRGLATSWSALISLVAGALFFALSSLDLSPSANQFLMRHARKWLLLYVVFWLCYGWMVLVWLPTQTTQAAPAMTHDHNAVNTTITPITSPFVAQVTALWPAFSVVGLVCYGVAMFRYCQLYRRTPSQTGFALACGITLLGESLLSQRFSQTYTLSFWLYHLQEFIGFGVISYAILVAYSSGQTDENLLENLFLPGTRARLRESYHQAMRALLATLEQGERPTPALRQTLRAQFRLGEGQLEVFEQAATAIAQERKQRQELEQLNTVLRQLERDRDEFTQMLVHDLRSPLTGLVGFLDLLRRGTLSDDQQELVALARRSGRNLAGLIDDLLDIGRMENGHIELTRSTVALKPLFEACVDEFSGWLQQDEKVISIIAPDDLPCINVDERLLRRVLFNLLSNAIKHTPAHTHITLQALTKPIDAIAQAVVIEVEDTGKGIPAEYLDRIFEKYGRVKNETDRRHTSTGLGLTFCRLAVEAHGGKLDVTSIVGQGTTFSIMLPLQ